MAQHVGDGNAALKGGDLDEPAERWRDVDDGWALRACTATLAEEDGRKLLIQFSASRGCVAKPSAPWRDVAYHGVQIEGSGLRDISVIVPPQPRRVALPAKAEIQTPARAKGTLALWF